VAKTTGPQRIDLSVHFGKDIHTVQAALTRAGVQVAAPVQAAGPLAMVYQVLILNKQTWPGAVVEPVTLGTTVIGFRIDTQTQVAALQSQVNQLKGGSAAQAVGTVAPPKARSRAAREHPGKG